MSRCAGLAFLLLALAMPAAAGLTKAEIDTVGVFPPEDARLPLALRFPSAGGQVVSLRAALGGTPSVVVFVDYSCRTLCGPIVAMTSEALTQTGLVAGRDFHLAIIGIDAKDDAATANAFVGPQLAPAIASATSILSGNADSIVAATRALGYRYAYDREHDQFAHPTAAFVVGRDGSLASAVSALGLRGRDLRLALVAAGQGKVGTLADQVRLLCYHYDPATGVYSASINWLIDGAALLNVLALGGGLLLLRRRDRAARRA